MLGSHERRGAAHGVTSSHIADDGIKAGGGGRTGSALLAGTALKDITDAAERASQNRRRRRALRTVRAGVGSKRIGG